VTAAVHDLLVVGGGVAGLAMAIAADRARVPDIVVLEQRRQSREVHKGEFLQPATLDVLDRWGIAAELEGKGALRLDGLECRRADGRQLGGLSYRTLPHRLNYGLVHTHTVIRDTLLARAEQVADLRFGCHVTGVLTEGGRVVGVTVRRGGVSEDIRASLVVAADGANSTLRRQLGIPFTRVPYGHGYLGFDVDNPRLPPRAVNFVTTDGARILYPMPGDRGRLYVQIPAQQVSSARRLAPDERRAQLLATCPGLDGVLAPWPELDSPQGFSAYRARAAEWVRPGVVLIGEAAHVMHPMAGQGMNTSIIDGWSLAAALERVAAPRRRSADGVDAALAAYTASRMLEVTRTMQMSHRLARMCSTTSRLGHRMLRFLLRPTPATADLRLEAAARLAGLENSPLGARSWARAVIGI
jgi:2-polyprenyl-6-methoxyphenol hydroxylase-like FAD-dependent oxidoreductase